MAWITSLLLALVKRLVPRVVCWYCTPARGEVHREADRLRWWTFSLSAERTRSKADDALAAYLKARFNFHDSPDAKESKKWAGQAGLLHDEAVRQWDGPAADRGKP